MSNLYQQQIIERAKHPLFSGETTAETHHAVGINLSCGDEIQWSVAIEHDTFVVMRHTCRACAICGASADLLAEALTGKSVGEVQTWNTEKVMELLGIPLSPIRLKCALLPLEALKDLKQT